MTDITNYDGIIIGGGAAGLSAALVLSRARRRVLVVDAGSPRNAPAAHLHGFLSRDGLPPAELLAIGRREIAGYGGELVTDTVAELTRLTDPVGFVLRLASGRRVTGRRLLVATGLTDELPDLPGVRERWGRDVVHCPYCHGWEVRDAPLGVLGSGPMAVHQALLVSRWSADVVLFGNGLEITEEQRADLAALGVPVYAELVTGLVIEDDRLTGVALADGSVVARAAVFVGPRFVAHDELLAKLGCERTEEGWVRTDPTGLTSVPGVWAAGNVVSPFAQLITAAGAAAAAAGMLNADLLADDIRLARASRLIAAHR